MTILRPTSLLLALVIPTIAAAQHDYRNLDHGRPIATEDAYPVERHALEVMFPWSLEREGGESGLMFEPEVMWGAVLNGMVGLGAPIAIDDGGGLAGLRPFAFYNFNTEGRWPAIGVRVDGSLPVGTLGGDEAAVSVTLLATASPFPATRVHLNGSLRLAGGDRGPLEDAPPSLSHSLGLDHTLWRHSAVVMMDVQRNAEGDVSWWIVGAGVRMQATPTMVFDIGAQRRLSSLGPDLVITAGLTRSFSLAGGAH
jgi:hypothetical protein